MSLFIDSRSLWLADTNCYVVAPEKGGPCVVIDAPGDLDGIAQLLADNDLYPQALLVTHAHIDHAGAAAGVVDRYSVNAYLHPEDEWLAAEPMEQLRSLFGGAVPDFLNGGFEPPQTWTSIQDGESLNLAGIDFEVLHTPGHTPGHCCFHIADEGLLFAGDQLFAGSIGRTDLPGGNYAALMTSMKQRVLTLDDQTMVLPGHGPATTISRERLSNPFLVDL